MHAADFGGTNGTPILGVRALRRVPRRRGWMMADSDGVIRFSTVGKWALTGIVTAHIGLMGWALAQASANGRALEAMRAELGVRVQKADTEHASYVTRGELVEIVRRIDERLGDVAEALRAERAAAAPRRNR